MAPRHRLTTNCSAPPMPRSGCTKATLLSAFVCIFLYLFFTTIDIIHKLNNKTQINLENSTLLESLNIAFISCRSSSRGQSDSYCTPCLWAILWNGPGMHSEDVSSFLDWDCFWLFLASGRCSICFYLTTISCIPQVRGWLRLCSSPDCFFLHFIRLAWLEGRLDRNRMASFFHSS